MSEYKKINYPKNNNNKISKKKEFQKNNKKKNKFKQKDINKIDFEINTNNKNVINNQSNLLHLNDNINDEEIKNIRNILIKDKFLYKNEFMKKKYTKQLRNK